MSCQKYVSTLKRFRDSLIGLAGTHLLLAPTVNTQRSPLGGRGFESFSEDPHLNGTIAASYINGLQSTGVSATIKHFVANDQEFERQVSSSSTYRNVLSLTHIMISLDSQSAVSAQFPDAFEPNSI